MADPKGPESGQDAKGAHSARPRSPTLDLSATDVTPKPDPAAPKPGVSDAKPDSAKPDSTKPDSAKPDATKPGASTLKPDPLAPKPGDKPAGAAASAASSTASSSAASSAAGGASRPTTPADAKPASSAQSSATAKAPEASKATDPKASDAKPFDSKPADAKVSDAKPSSSAASSAASPQPKPSASGPSVPPPAPQAAREGVGPLGVAAAAIGGAALAVLAIALFGKQLIGAPEPDMSRVSTLEAKLDALGSDIAALRDQSAKSARTADTSAIDGRLQELSKSIEASNGRVGGVESELKALSEQVAKPDEALGVLAGRVDGLEMRFQKSPTADELSVLGGRLAGVETRTASLPTKEAVAAVSTQVQGVAKKVDDVAGPLNQRVDEIAAELKAKPEGDPAARMVVALGALDQALADGRPFAAELAAVKAASGENAELATLDPFAASGVPTRPQLAATLSAELAKLAPVKPAGETSVFDRFVASAGSVVKVTPKGGSTGDDPASVRDRVAAAAASGDIEGAIAARGKLDDAARSATEEWSRLATARVAAENALNGARTAALARLTAND